MQSHSSEVARLLNLINAEYEAAERGLSGLASGVSHHQFITAKMEHMEILHQKLRHYVGDHAMALIANELNKLPPKAPNLPNTPNK